MTRRPSDVPKSVIAQLNRGERESANLAESLAIDLAALCKHAGLGAAGVKRMKAASGDGYVGRMKLAAACFLDEAGGRDDAAAGEAVIETLGAHESDTVRGFGALAVDMLPKRTLNQRLKLAKPFADDPHFGVREWAWIGVRDAVCREPHDAIWRLARWTTSKSAALRRFASEATRPRGVWCAHIKELKADPEPGLVVLEPVRTDGEKYVQDSVANWLNDAGKTSPDWVRGVCARWEGESGTPETQRIIRRAMRNLR